MGTHTELVDDTLEVFWCCLLQKGRTAYRLIEEPIGTLWNNSVATVDGFFFFSFFENVLDAGPLPRLYSAGKEISICWEVCGLVDTEGRNPFPYSQAQGGGVIYSKNSPAYHHTHPPDEPYKKIQVIRTTRDLGIFERENQSYGWAV